jgi:beta-phosphoglucomutase-like phosphatase (HAD superfamily)
MRRSMAQPGTELAGGAKHGLVNGERVLERLRRTLSITAAFSTTLAPAYAGRPHLGILSDNGSRVPYPRLPNMRLIAFDWGHTLMDERRNVDAVHLMPDVREVLPQLDMPLAVWANTKTAGEREVRRYLARAGIEQFFTWVVTSVDAGARKPAPGFFEFALDRCGVTKDDVLFIGNQLNTDIKGGESSGIRTVWLSGAAYHSDDDDGTGGINPTYTIQWLRDLPSLLLLIKGGGHCRYGSARV